jgi:hypothetical protein
MPDPQFLVAGLEAFKLMFCEQKKLHFHKDKKTQTFKHYGTLTFRINTFELLK